MDFCGQPDARVDADTRARNADPQALQLNSLGCATKHYKRVERVCRFTRSSMHRAGKTSSSSRMTGDEWTGDVLYVSTNSL